MLPSCGIDFSLYHDMCVAAMPRNSRYPNPRQTNFSEVPNEKWVADVAGFAMHLAGRAKSEASCLKQGLRILSSLRGSVPLQQAVLANLRQSYQRNVGNPNSFIDAILEMPSSQADEEACNAFCISQLQHSLRRIVAAGQFQPDQWQRWIVSSDQGNNSKYMELVLHYALSCACGSCRGTKAMGCSQKVAIPQAWTLQSESKEDELGSVQVTLILQHLGFWQKLVQIASKHVQPDPAQILRPLNASLKTLADKVAVEALTAQEIDDTGSLAAWGSPIFIELLSQEKPVEVLQPKLQNMIEKVRFLKRFQEAVDRKLPSLFPGEARAKRFGQSLRRAFLKASNINQSEEIGHPELSVEMAALNQEAWSETFTQDKAWWDDDLQLNTNAVLVPNFYNVESAIQTLFVARSERHKPLRSLFQEVEAKMAIAATQDSQMKVLDIIFLMHQEIVVNLQQLSELGGEEAGLRPGILRAIEKHWSGVAPDMVPETLRNIQGMTSFFRGDLTRLQDRLVAVLRGRQTADFWRMCRKIEITLCSVFPNKTIPSGFSSIMQLQAASLEAMRNTFEAAGEETGVGLKTEDLDSVSRATERTMELFDFLGPGGATFEMVFRLVASMADVPGLSFLKVLLSSVHKGEHLATRLAELVEGALTQETLDSVEQASVWFMPLCVAVLAAMDIRIDGSKVQQMAGSSWPRELQDLALQARSQADIGALMLKLMAEALHKDGHKLPERIECLRSALRQGQVVQQKLEETSDDARNGEQWAPAAVPQRRCHEL